MKNKSGREMKLTKKKADKGQRENYKFIRKIGMSENNEKWKRLLQRLSQIK